MKSEAQIEGECRRVVEKDYGGELIKVRVVGRRGCVDRLLVLRQLRGVVFIEFKREDGVPSAGQIRFAARMRMLGKTHWTVRSVEEFKEMLAFAVDVGGA